MGRTLTLAQLAVFAQQDYFFLPGNRRRHRKCFPCLRLSRKVRNALNKCSV